MHYLPLVNTKMGTASHPRRSYGNTLPLTQLPFGMASFCPQTEVTRAWFYHPEHEFAEGVRLTHQFSPWIGDFGAFLLTPQNDCVANTGAGAWSGVRTQDSLLAPHYLRMHFMRPNCTLELTPTERCAALRLRFGDSRTSFLCHYSRCGDKKQGSYFVILSRNLRSLWVKIRVQNHKEVLL